MKRIIFIVALCISMGAKAKSRLLHLTDKTEWSVVCKSTILKKDAKSFYIEYETKCGKIHKVRLSNDDAKTMMMHDEVRVTIKSGDKCEVIPVVKPFDFVVEL